MRASEPGVGRWGPNSNSKPEVAAACSRPWPLAHAHVHVRARACMAGPHAASCCARASEGRFAPARRACNRACPHLGDMI